MEMLNLPWLLGGITTSFVISKVGDYVIKKDAVSRVSKFTEGLEKYSEILSS